MQSEWPLSPIGEVAKVFDGPHATPKKTSAGPVFLGISSLNNGRLDLAVVEYLSEDDFTKWTRRVAPQVGDVVFSYETRLGQVAIIPPGLRCCLGRRMALVRCDRSRLLPRYFLYYFLSDEFQALLKARTIHGSTVERLPLTDFPSYPVRLPSLETQRQVSDVLTTIDDRIDLLRQTNATLESIAQALFKSWFIDFDPVRAKAEGREPEGMDAATAALFPAEFDESTLGLIPKGWRVETLSALCESIFSGGTPDTRKAEYWNGTLPWFSSGETRESVVIGTEKHITEAAVDNSSTRLARPGDVLIASAGQGLTRGQTSYCALDTYINQSVVSVRTSREVASPAWTFYNLVRRYDELRGLSDSHSIRGSLTTKLLASLRVIAPPVSLMQRFGTTAEAMLAAQADNRRQARSLADLRDTLLPRLISGKLRLPEVQEQAEAALA